MHHQKVLSIRRFLGMSLLLGLLGTLLVSIDTFAEPETNPPPPQEKGIVEEFGEYKEKAKKKIKGTINRLIGGVEKVTVYVQDIITPDILKKSSQDTKEINTIKPEHVHCRLDYSCHVNSFLFFTAKSAGDALNDSFVKLFVLDRSALAKMKIIRNYYHYTQQLAWTLLLLFFVYQLIRTLALYIFNQDPTELQSLIQKVFFAAIMISMLFWIVEQLVELNRLTIQGLLNTNTNNLINMALLFGGKQVILTQAAEGFQYVLAMSLIFCFVMVCGCAIFFIQLAIRYAEIAFMVIIGPIVAATIINKEFNLFPIWWRHLLSVVFTQAIQVLMMVILFNILYSMAAFNANHNIPILQNFILGVGFVILIIRTPHFLKQWMYSSGSINLLKSTMKTSVKAVVAIAKIAVVTPKA